MIRSALSALLLAGSSACAFAASGVFLVAPDTFTPIGASSANPLFVTSGSSVGTASNGTDAQAPTASNTPSVAYNYIWNGSSWDRQSGTGGAITTRIYQPTYQLLSNASATGSVITGVYGASYLYNTVGTFGSGCTVALQALAADGVTYQTVSSVTAAGTVGVVLGNNASVKAVVSGTCSGLYASLS